MKNLLAIFWFLFTASAMAGVISGHFTTDTSVYPTVYPFARTATLTSAAAATAVPIIADSEIKAGLSVYLSDFFVAVNGAVSWLGVTNCYIEDTTQAPFVTVPLVALTGSSMMNAASTGLTVNNAMKLGSGGTSGKGLQIRCNANGSAGSNLVVTVFGVIK